MPAGIEGDARKLLQSAPDGGTMGLGAGAPSFDRSYSGLASGIAGDTDGYTTIDSVRGVDLSDREAVMREVEDFGERFKNADVEHARVITPGGKVYDLTGTSWTVNTELVGADELKGSVVAHNHPPWQGYDRGDSFSLIDFITAAKHKTAMNYLFSGVRRNAFVYTGAMTGDDAYRAYKAAFAEVWNGALSGDTVLEFEQEAVMRKLAETLREVVFIERF
jgi:hypothetical protein